MTRPPIRLLLGSCSAALLLVAAAACGTDDEPVAPTDAAAAPADADADADGSAPGAPPACSELFVEGRGTQETLDAVPTDAQGFQVCSDGQITNQFATMTKQCVNDSSKQILYNPFGYGFADGTWELVPENTPLGTGLPVC